MIRISGGICSDLCDPQLKLTRRDLLRVGGAGLLGLSLGSLLKLRALASESPKPAGGPGWGKAKSVVLIYLQGGGPATSTCGIRRKTCPTTCAADTFSQSCLLARRLLEAGTRLVEVIWPKVANSDNHSWDHHSDLTKGGMPQSP